MKLKNGMTLQIREAVKEDAQEIIDYLNLVGGESDNLLFGANEFHMTIEGEENFIESMADSKTSALFVGKINEEVVCVGSMVSGQRERIAHQAELAVSVKKKYWGIGVGTQLIQTIIDFAKSNHTTEILHLGVRAENIAAIKLYKKMGFKQIGVYKNFFKINGKHYDEILMNLNI